ncbi:MAG: hypothetical protein IPP49_09930 [Saprospiraceae bacterium]|nr:hypothetical protein [Saprospiraceae bacterium]
MATLTAAPVPVVRAVALLHLSLAGGAGAGALPSAQTLKLVTFVPAVVLQFLNLR